MLVFRSPRHGPVSAGSYQEEALVMAKTSAQIDRNKLRVALRKLRKDELVALLDGAIDVLPAARLPALIEGFIAPHALRPEPLSGGTLLRTVKAFGGASLRGEYYEGFAVNSKNYMEMSNGSKTWIAECNRLLDRCVASARERPRQPVRAAFEIIFDLLRDIDVGNDDIIFFADEGGAWQVGVEWRPVLSAYFGCLAESATPEEYAATVTALIDEFEPHDRARHLRAARAQATPAQKKALRGA